MASSKLKTATKSAKASGAVKSKGAAAAKTKTFPLSQELIDDSDSNANNDDSDSESDAALSKAGAASLAASMLNGKAKKNKTTEPSASASKKGAASLSSEEDQEEDESEDDAQEESSASPSPSLKKPDIAAPKVNGVKRKTSSQDETASKSSDESDEEDRASKKARTTDASSSQKNGGTAGQQDETTATQPQASKRAHSSLATVPVQAFVPPHGFRAVDTSSSTIAPVPQLEGKTIWHISAPAGIPISLMKSMTVAAMKSGKPVFSHENTEYTLTEVSAPEQAIFVPGKDGYKAARQAVKKSFKLRPAFTLPTIPARAAARDAGSLAAGNIATAAVTSIRPQPKHLKMRYRPPGFGTGNPGIIGGDSDSDEESQPKSTFQFPRAVGPSTDGDGTKTADGTSKKKKASKKQKDLANSTNGFTQHVEPQAAPLAKVPAALDKIAADIVDDDETTAADEKARRKAEKRARKEAKRKAQAEAL